MTHQPRMRSFPLTARPLVCCVLSLAAMLTLSACNKASLSTPKEAAQTFATALENGDADTAKKASTGADPKFVESMATATGNMKKYRDAMVAKFGDEGKNGVGGKVPLVAS